MKKILVFLLVLLSAQGAYSSSDGDEFDFEYEDILNAVYYGYIDDSAIRAMCKRFLDYAFDRDFRPSYTSSDGKIYYFQKENCDDDNMGVVKLITLQIAKGLDQAGLLGDLQSSMDCVQETVKMAAWHSKTAVVRSREYQGYNFDFNNSEVECLDTSSGYKCVINVSVDKGEYDYNYTACYKVPYNVCESGGYFVPSYETMGKIGIGYFDDNCAPNYK